MGIIYNNHVTGYFLIKLTLLGALVAGGNEKLFETGTGQSYLFTSTVVLNEPADQAGKDVGYQIRGDVNVGVIWQNDEEINEKLLEIELAAPKLLIKSRKAPSPDGFDIHKSELEKAVNSPFLIHWKSGKIINIYIRQEEDASIRNLKKGISSLFQFQVTDAETKETDTSGHCLVIYKSLDAFSFSKTKVKCVTPSELPSRRKSTKEVLGANITSSRSSTYKLSRDLSSIEEVTAVEYHDLKMIIKKEVGGTVSASQHLIKTGKEVKVSVFKSANVQDAIKSYEKQRGFVTVKHNFNLQTSSPNCDKEDCPSLPKLVKENREYLSTSSLGTLKSATAFVRLLSAARASTKDDLIKAFKGTKNREILNQLSDLAGAIQLPESHEVIKKLINFDSDEDLDKSERYLWALGVGSHPQESVIKDLYKMSQKPHPNEKLSETLILTLAAMAHRFSKIVENGENSLLNDIRESILGELELCKEENCKIKFLRALKNLKCPKTLPILMKYSLYGKRKTAVEAMKAVRSFEPDYWTEDVIEGAQRIYFQVGKKYDSSTRTLAVDILLESNPRREILQELLLSLTERDPAYEVKQYLAQRVKQMAENKEGFSALVDSITTEFMDLFNNYNVRARRGLTTAFARDFANDDLRNGSLSVVLEISKGLLKRGIVDVELHGSGKKTSLFTLGLFAGGLSSFVSSDGEKDEVSDGDGNEEATTTAGMELAIMGAHIRPFVFFEGQGELMGHVWSGTASEKTPAYQALILAIDILENIPLQNGFLAQVEILGGVSFDLSGQIQISLWNRNAHSLVEKCAGISLQGRINVDSSFVRSKIEFNVGTEVKLNLQSDINFYSGTSLCMQLSQPEVLIRHNVHKVERIFGGKHRLRKSKYTQVTIPGRTYALNRKNNEMCNVIFN